MLIISCSTGSGHVKSAEALRLTCQKDYPNCQALHIDMADYMSWIAKLLFVHSYDALTSFFSKFYGFFYNFTDKQWLHKFLKWLRPIFTPCAKKLFAKIREYNPDVIISTHFFPQIIFSDNFKIPVNVVITDFHAHQIWISNNAKRFFVSSEAVKAQMNDLADKITVSGLPIHPKFFEDKDLGALKKKLEINPNLPVILVMPINKGSIKLKDAVKTIFSYNQNLNLAVIAGRNKQTYADLAKIKNDYKNLILIKQTDDVDEWMKVSDIIISKAGGLTVSETIHLNKPLIIINSIPGQEQFNTNYIVENNYGFSVESSDDLAKKIELITSGKEKIKSAPISDANKIILDKIFSELQ